MEEQLLYRYMRGEVSKEERTDIIRWLDADPGNMKEFIRVRRLYDIAVWQDETGGHQVNMQKKALVRKLKPMLAWAATFAGVILAVVYYLHSDRQPASSIVMHTVQVPTGQQVPVSLPDGTRVWLNTKSTFSYPEQFTGQTREVHLDGEGYFEVAKDREKPFIVHAPQYSIRVLGTKFNVTAYSRWKTTSFETSLFEGAVELSGKDGSEKLRLVPGERVHLENDRLVKGVIGNDTPYLWRKGIISFKNGSFSDLIREIERYYDVEISVKNQKLLDYRYTGKFRIRDGVEHILKVLQMDKQFNYRIDKEQKTIIIE